MNTETDKLLDEIYRHRAQSVRLRARRAAKCYAERVFRSRTSPNGRNYERAARNYYRLMKLVAGLA